MKNIMRSIMSLLLSAFLSISLYGQTKDDKISDKEMNDKLVKDVNARYPKTVKSIIIWDNSEYGYDGTYSVDGMNYMIRYDKNGRYIETLAKRDWDKSAPAIVRDSFNNSPYKSYKVDSYWEVSDPVRKSYYIRAKDNKGKYQKIWIDEDGRVYDEPEYKRNKDMK